PDQSLGYYIPAVWRAQADALVIEAQAKRRLADEYDAAQERGEVARSGQHGKAIVTTQGLGLTCEGIQEARELRDAEVAEPGIVRRTVDKAVASGEKPTKAGALNVERPTHNVAYAAPERLQSA